MLISDNECLGTCFSGKIIEIGHILAEISVFRLILPNKKNYSEELFKICFIQYQNIVVVTHIISGPPSQVFLPSECQTPKMSSIRMDQVVMCLVFRCLLYFENRIVGNR